MSAIGRSAEHKDRRSESQQECWVVAVGQRPRYRLYQAFVWSAWEFSVRTVGGSDMFPNSHVIFHQFNPNPLYQLCVCVCVSWHVCVCDSWCSMGVSVELAITHQAVDVLTHTPTLSPMTGLGC